MITNGQHHLARHQERVIFPMGRHTDYTVQKGVDICEALIDGKSLRAICTPSDMPDRQTVFRWLEQFPEFAAMYARARQLQAEIMDDLILETADACKNDTAAADRVRIAAYQWRAARLRPKRYGERQTVEHEGAVEIATVKVTDKNRAQAMALLLARKAGEREEPI